MIFRSNVEVHQQHKPFRAIFVETPCDDINKIKKIWLPLAQTIGVDGCGLPVGADLAINQRGVPIVVPGNSDGVVWLGVVHTGMYVLPTRRLWLNLPSSTVSLSASDKENKGFDFSGGRILWLKKSRGEKLSSFGFIFFAKNPRDKVIFQVGKAMTVVFHQDTVETSIRSRNEEPGEFDLSDTKTLEFKEE